MVGARDLEANRAAMFSGNSTGPFSNHAGIHRTFASRGKWTACRLMTGSLI